MSIRSYNIPSNVNVLRNAISKYDKKHDFDVIFKLVVPCRKHSNMSCDNSGHQGSQHENIFHENLRSITF